MVVVTAPPMKVEVRMSVVTIRLGHVPGWEQATTDEERVDAIVDFQGRWLEQWWTLLRSRAVVAAAYAGAPTGNLIVVQSVTVGCLASQWLQEHLQAEGYRPRVSRRAAVRDAHCLANTHKHAGRSQRLRVGRLLSFERSGEGCRVTSVFAVPGASNWTSRDGLQMLDGCVEAWEAYLRSQNLDPIPLPDER
jgi:hypothetical protein